MTKEKTLGDVILGSIEKQPNWCPICGKRIGEFDLVCDDEECNARYYGEMDFYLNQKEEEEDNE
jgi:hypothetical protein